MSVKKGKKKIDFGKKLGKSFFLQDTEHVALQLLNKILVKIENDGTVLAGKIVETEAYLHGSDEASHSFPGVTDRNRPMFEEGGILYVYKSYGIHHCINVVTEKEGIGAAVLIRALEPLEGIEIMQERRGVADIFRLCKGPGNTAKAFGFTKEDNYSSLTSDNLYISNAGEVRADDIIRAKRIGITRSNDLLLRFYLKNSKFISRK